MNRWIFLRDIIYNSLSSSSGESDHMHATVACYRSASSHSRNKKNPRLLFMNIDLLGWSSRLKDSLIIEVRLDWTRLIEFWNSIFLKAGWTVLVRVSMTDLGSEKDGRWENWLTARRPVPACLISYQPGQWWVDSGLRAGSSSQLHQQHSLSPGHTKNLMETAGE